MEGTLMRKTKLGPAKEIATLVAVRASQVARGVPFL
jgi:hypothetical protein